MSKIKTSILGTALAAVTMLLDANLMAGTVTISATGVTSSPIFVTSALGSITVGTEFRIGTFTDVNALNSTIATYKAGVTGSGNTLAEPGGRGVEIHVALQQHGKLAQQQL